MIPAPERARLLGMRRGSLVPAVLAAAVLAFAGCGSDDDGDDSGSGGSDATPAETILSDAGLEVCGEAQDQVAQSIGEEGVQNVRAFAVAEDCGGEKTSADTITVFQFSSIDTRDTGATAISAAYDRGIVMTSGALVIVAAGPNREANADAVGRAYTDSTGAPVETV
jgi:hypothetical protein